MIRLLRQVLQNWCTFCILRSKTKQSQSVSMPVAPSLERQVSHIPVHCLTSIKADITPKWMYSWVAAHTTDASCTPQSYILPPSTQIHRTPYPNLLPFYSRKKMNSTDIQKTQVLIIIHKPCCEQFYVRATLFLQYNLPELLYFSWKEVVPT